MTGLKEFDAVVLTAEVQEWITEDLRGTGFHPGDFGYIADMVEGREYVTVEFKDEDGHTIGIADVRLEQLRPATKQDFAPRKISA